MITRAELETLGFSQYGGNKNNYFLPWDYTYNFVTRELFFINDGFGEPLFIAKIINVQHLIEVCFLYDGTELLKNEN